MSPRSSTSEETPGEDAPPEESPTEESPGEDAPVNPNDNVQAINDAMAAAAEKEAADQAAPSYPPGAGELNATNVRRYPELFTDEQRATIPGDELPETDIEKAQREQAEAAAAEESKAS